MLFINQENGPFLKRVFKPEEFENVDFSIQSCDFSGRIVLKEKSKVTGDCYDFKFSPALHFQMPSFGAVWTRPGIAATSDKHVDHSFSPTSVKQTQPAAEVLKSRHELKNIQC